MGRAELGLHPLYHLLSFFEPLLLLQGQLQVLLLELRFDGRGFLSQVADYIFHLSQFVLELARYLCPHHSLHQLPQLLPVTPHSL